MIGAHKRGLLTYIKYYMYIAHTCTCICQCIFSAGSSVAISKIYM